MTGHQLLRDQAKSIHKLAVWNSSKQHKKGGYAVMRPKCSSVLNPYSRKPCQVWRASEGVASQTRIDEHHDRYCAEVDNVRQEQWDEILQMFDDSSLMQTWGYGSVRWGEKNLSHVLLRKNGKIVAASQAVIFKAPLLPIGLAFVRWGPCWQVKGQTKDFETFRHMMQVLYQIYVVERRLLLQIFPNAVEDGTGTLRAILNEEGFQSDPHGTPTRTAIVDLSYPLEELRQSLKRKWRHNLVLAERNRLTVTSGVDDKTFQDLMILHTEMRVRKRWEPIPDVRFLALVQRALPPPLKMTCMICRHNGKPASGIAVSKAGNTAVLVLAPTGSKGLTLRSSYLIQWRVLEWLKDSNVRWYDLSFISPHANPGLYQFKSGLRGKLGSEFEYVGDHQAGNHPIIRFSVHAFKRSCETLCNMRRTLGRLLDGRVGAP